MCGWKQQHYRPFWFLHSKIKQNFVCKPPVSRNCYLIIAIPGKLNLWLKEGRLFRNELSTIAHILAEIAARRSFDGPSHNLLNMKLIESFIYVNRPTNVY